MRNPEWPARAEREKDQKEVVGVLPESLAQPVPEELNTGMLKDMSHESPVLSPICQELLLQSVISVLNGLKHGYHPFGHLLLNSCVSSLLGCQMSLLLWKRLKYRSQSRINSRRGSRGSTGTPSLVIMWARRLRRRWRDPKVIIIIIIIIIISGGYTLGLELSECLSLNIWYWIWRWDWVLRGWTIGTKLEARGLEGALELRQPDHLREDVTEVMSIRQLMASTETIKTMSSISQIRKSTMSNSECEINAPSSHNWIWVVASLYPILGSSVCLIS
jgi:hypothetical protein